jgi:hypothetical protein
MEQPFLHSFPKLQVDLKRHAFAAWSTTRTNQLALDPTTPLARSRMLR